MHHWPRPRTPHPPQEPLVLQFFEFQDSRERLTWPRIKKKQAKHLGRECCKSAMLVLYLLRLGQVKTSSAKSPEDDRIGCDAAYRRGCIY